MSGKGSLTERRAAVVPKGVGLINPTATAVTGSGAHVTDADGRRVIDFAGGIGVMNVGHCHGAVVKAVQEQAARLLHTCIHVATYEPYVALCEALVARFPHGGPTKAFLVNTGAEAVENAVKIARQATGRQAVITFTEAFHGRTMLALTLTSKAGYKVGCGPFAPEVYRLPFPNRYRYGDGLDEQAFVERELTRFRQALVNLVPARHVAAVIIEPVQGEGGFVPAPFAYLRGLRELCHEHGILLIADEVQSGFGRTGRWAAYEHAGIIPDLSTWAKSMGGGMPIAAVLGKSEVMDAAAPGTLGGTYGGNPVACAAALATMRVLEQENLVERGAAIGRTIMDRFAALRRKHSSVIGDVRGLGAMVGMELVEDGDPERPNGKLAGALLKACLDQGVLLITAGSHGNVIRVLSPLMISDADLERGLSVIETELARLDGGKAAPTATPASARR